MEELARDGMTMIVVSHEMRFAHEAADAIVMMDEGQIIEEAPPDRFFRAPSHERTRRFLQLMTGVAGWQGATLRRALFDGPSYRLISLARHRGSGGELAANPQRSVLLPRPVSPSRTVILPAASRAEPLHGLGVDLTQAHEVAEWIPPGPIAISFLMEIRLVSRHHVPSRRRAAWS